MLSSFHQKSDHEPHSARAHTLFSSHTKNAQMVLDFARFFFCCCCFFINTHIKLKYCCCTSRILSCVCSSSLCRSVGVIMCGFQCHYISVLFSIFGAIHQDGTLKTENKNQFIIHNNNNSNQKNVTERTFVAHPCMVN